MRPATVVEAKYLQRAPALSTRDGTPQPLAPSVLAQPVVRRGYSAPVTEDPWFFRSTGHKNDQSQAVYGPHGFGPFSVALTRNRLSVTF